jgi:hypothetical protein
MLINKYIICDIAPYRRPPRERGESDLPTHVLSESQDMHWLGVEKGAPNTDLEPIVLNT